MKTLLQVLFIHLSLSMFITSVGQILSHVGGQAAPDRFRNQNNQL